MIRNVKANTLGLAKQLGVEEVIAKILVNRDIYSLEDAKKFTKGTLKDLYDGSLMKDMDKALKIFKENLRNKKNILIVGDYDVDGVISSYILYSALKDIGAEVSYHIPDRITEGYGINESIIRKAKENDISLIITCDNGIAALNQVRLARELGMQIIVTDHHDIPFVERENGNREFIIPEADAVINPKQRDCTYPFKKLCGAVVAFKFVQCIYKELGIDRKKAERYIEFAAIATVCDVVDLIGENRIIVKEGLKMINRTENLGISALIEETGLQKDKINAYHLGFVIGPCINATGRLENAELSLKLLLSADYEEAAHLAKKLHELNEERQDMTSEGVNKAVDIIENSELKDQKVLVIYIPELHESIAGIIAGRIREKYNLPVIVLTKSKEGVKGSARSIENYNIFEELLKCKDLLDKFGGHPMAAGLSLKEENVDIFRKRINDICSLTEEDIVPKIVIDAKMPFEDISLRLAENINSLQPFGKGNSKPIFAEKRIKLKKGDILGKNKNVLKLIVESIDNTRMEAVIFNDIEKFENLITEEYGKEELDKVYSGSRNKVALDIVFNVDINEYMDRKNIQLQIISFRKAI